MKSLHLSLNRAITPVLLALAAAVAPLHAGEAHYLSLGEPDAAGLLAPPPLPDSPEQAADLAEVRSVCHVASSNDIVAAFSERKFSVFNFTPVIGEFFQPGKLPQAAAFFNRVHQDTERATDDAKTLWKRPRPFLVDPTLASGKLEKSYSYPSGHSTESMVLALVLADLFPARHDAILAEARSIGWHRVEIARHYPTDIYAGRVFAQAIVQEMKKNPAFQADFSGVKAEIAAIQATARN
jgi:acid phosphatase (class A)